MLNPDDLQALLRWTESGITTAEDAERLRAHIDALEAQASEATFALHGHTVFVGPCVHGRDPWDRCDECGEETAVHALLKVRAMLEANIAALVQDATKAAAELRHAFGHLRFGQSINPDLVERGIRILEFATSQPHPGAALLERMQRLKNWARLGLLLYHGNECKMGRGAYPEDPAECEDPECREWAKALEEK